MFPTDPALSTYIMKRVIEQGGLQPGGLNFDAKVCCACCACVPTLYLPCLLCTCHAYSVPAMLAMARHGLQELPKPHPNPNPNPNPTLTSAPGPSPQAQPLPPHPNQVRRES